MQAMDQTKFSPLKPRVVLGVAAHPDDLDFGSSGTMAKFAAGGAEVHYLILTDGSKGTADEKLKPEQLTNMRQKEQQAALEAVGGKQVHFLNYCDGELEVTLQLKKDIVRVIRELRPDVVITMDPTIIYSTNRGIINHPDHRAAGQATLDAVYPLARDPLAFPELAEEGLKPHKTPVVLLNNFEKHNFVVDISDTFDNKLAALKAHGSQIADMSRVESWLRPMAEKVGEEAGFKLGEGFIRLDIRL